MPYDGRVVFSTKLDNSQIGKQLNELETKIKKSQEKISSLENAKLPYTQQIKELNAELDTATQKLKKLKEEQSRAAKVLENANRSPEDFDAKYYVDPDAFAEISKRKPDLDAEIVAQQKIVDALQKEWKQANAEVTKYDREIQKATDSIEKNKLKTGQLRAKLVPNASKMSQAFYQVQDSASRFGKRLWEIAKSAFIFNIISAGLRAVASYMGSVLKTNSEYAAQLAQLKGALLTAFQPIYEFILPGLLAIQEVLITIVRMVAAVTSALFGKTTSQSAKNAAALNKQAKAIGGVGDAAEEAKKQLMGFDEINRLESTSSGGAAGGGGVDTISPDFSGLDVNQYAETIDRLMAPLREIDFTALQASLSGLGDAFSKLGGIIKDSLEWAWFEILVPLSEWTIEEAAPKAIDSLASALNLLSEVLGPVMDGLKRFWEWIQPIVEFVQDTVILVFQKFQEAFDELARVFHEKGPEISGIISNIGETLAIVWELIRPTMEHLRELFSDVFSKVVEIVGKAIGRLIDLFYDLSEFIAGFLSQDWQRAWEGIKNVVEDAAGLITDIVYGLRDLIGRIIDGILQAIYDVLAMIDGWFGGQSSTGSSTNASTSNAMAYSARMQFASVPPTSAMQIPALAKGAVLPANKPFLAMVGDQKHGTNVEAPLETIEQALVNALVRTGVGAGGDIQINFTGDLAQLARILHPEISKQDRSAARSRGK